MAGQEYMPDGMPKFMGQRRGQPRTSWPVPMPEEQPRSGPEAMYDYLWPTVFWCIALYCIGLMATSLWKLMSQYDPWAHGQAAGISVVVVGLMAIVYKKVLSAPAEPTYYMEPPVYDQVPAVPSNNGERAA